MTAQELISQAYSAFNQRNIDAALKLMSERVSWPKASEGGRVVGKQEIRAYWTRQWAEFDPRVDVLEVVYGEARKIDVKVHQIVSNWKATSCPTPRYGTSISLRMTSSSAWTSRKVKVIQNVGPPLSRKAITRSDRERERRHVNRCSVTRLELDSLRLPGGSAAKRKEIIAPPYGRLNKKKGRRRRMRASDKRTCLCALARPHRARLRGPDDLTGRRLPAAGARRSHAGVCYAQRRRTVLAYGLPRFSSSSGPGSRPGTR